MDFFLSKIINRSKSNGDEPVNNNNDVKTVDLVNNTTKVDNLLNNKPARPGDGLPALLKSDSVENDSSLNITVNDNSFDKTINPGSDDTCADLINGLNGLALKTPQLIFNPSDFDFLLSKGDSTQNNYSRDSILERFDPLTGPRPSVIPNQLPVQKFSPIEERDSTDSLGECKIVQVEVAETKYKGGLLNITISEPVPSVLNSSKSPALNVSNEKEITVPEPSNEIKSNVKLDTDKKLDNSCGDESRSTSASESYVTASIGDPLKKANATMSVRLIHDMNSENMKTLEQVDQPKLKMNEEKVNKDFVEDYERKLKDAEAREEALLRRITEKEKAMNKISSVMENYEKTMVEMMTEREQLTQNHEQQIGQLKAERDANFHHLTSLETTFSDLHLKYEKSKQLATEVKENESKLLEKLEFAQQQIKAQELRYDKLKSHALTQLEHANAKLEALSKSHINEIKKLQAQLKKEEISRQSINEQLAQKTKENSELVKICDELINNGPDGS